MNYLWINLDQLRYDTLGCSGNPVCQTPAMDAVAARGVQFNRAYTPCSLCTPARASMFTGRYAFTHGLGTNCGLYHSLAPELPDPRMLLHHRLLEQGIKCSYVGKWHVGTKTGPLDYGFEGMNVPGYGSIREQDEFVAYLKSENLSYTIRPDICMNPDGKTVFAGLWDGPIESTPAYYLADRSIDFLKRHEEADESFFLTCNFWGPHCPHLPNGDYYGMHDRATIEPWINFHDDYSGKPTRIAREQTDFYRQRPSGWDEWRELVGLYYDFTSMIDAQIGRMISSLDELGLRDNTAIIITSDHGDMTGSHNQLLDKGFMYEEAHRIPLLIAMPDGGIGTCDDLVSNMDIFPTILDNEGLGVHDMDDRQLDGRSLLPVLQDPKSPTNWSPRDAMLMEFHGIRYLYSQRSVLTAGNWKYIFTPGDRDEVYDLNTDPGEMKNLINEPDCQTRVEQLREQLMQKVVEANDPIASAVFKYLGKWENPTGQHDPSQV